MGTVDERLREQFGKVLIAFTRSDADLFTDAVLQVCTGRRRVDRDLLRGDLARLLERYGHVGIGEISLAKLIDEVLEILRRHLLLLPRLRNSTLDSSCRRRSLRTPSG